MKHDRRVGLPVLGVSILLTCVGASWPLNPLVVRNAQPAGPVPAECHESLAPAPAPRVEVREIPPRETIRDRDIVPAVVPAPPSRTLRGELEAAHAALARNDRPAFDEHFANARAVLADYPPGGERNAAEEVMRALEDAAALWDAQFESPFFSDASDAYARASRYAGYAEAVRRSTFTDDRDRRFYPAAESRDFVTRIAGERLARLGIRTPTRTVRDRERRATPAPAPTAIARSTRTAPAAPSTRARRSGRATTSTARAATSTARGASRKPTIATSTTKSAAPAISAPSSPDPAAPAAAAAPAPAAPPETAPTPVPSASPVAVGDPPPATAPATAPSPDTGAAASTAEADPAPATPAPERRSVIVPALLILIGLGVLIVLFRASK